MLADIQVRGREELEIHEDQQADDQSAGDKDILNC
jgi:hypothetical protein